MQIHVVEPGQTLYSIARSYGLAPGFAARWNGLREPFRLAVGQSLLLLSAAGAYTVRPGDTLFSIARQRDLSAGMLWRLNPNLNGSAELYPGQVLLTDPQAAQTRVITAAGYAYPFADRRTLQGILPFSSELIPFTSGFTEEGDLLLPESGPLLALAELYGVRATLHLSTLTQNDTFSAERAAALLRSDAMQQRLTGQILRALRAQGFSGLDVDFEYLPRSLAASYAAFLARLHDALAPEGYLLTAALAPKTADDQPGLLYEGHDYALIGRACDRVLLMTYEWGYTYGPPQAVAPIDAVERVLRYARTRVAPEKILLGFPNYAYDWTLPYVRGQSRAQSIGCEQAPLLAARYGAEIQYDARAETPWFRYTDENGRVHEVWFEDARSALRKLRLIGTQALAGVGYWNYMRPFTACFCLQNELYAL